MYMTSTSAALIISPAQSAVVVAELVPAVLAWAKGPMAALHGDSLIDPRLTLHVGDIGPLIRTGPTARYDAILLDVDNGPDGLSRAANDRLYTVRGLEAAERLLGNSFNPTAIFASNDDMAAAAVHRCFDMQFSFDGLRRSRVWLFIRSRKRVGCTPLTATIRPR